MRLLVTDENFNRNIVRGLMEHAPELRILRVQDIGLLGASDPEVLAWAAKENAILLSHDVSTIPFFAYQRVSTGLPMPGVLMMPQLAPVGEMVEQIICSVYCLTDDEWMNQVRYLPL